MTRKLNNFTLKNNKILDGDQKEISHQEYNNLLRTHNNATHPLLIELHNLYNTIMGSDSGNYEAELRQKKLKNSKDTNLDLFLEVKNRYNTFDKQN